jgi:hypothetical protein
MANADQDRITIEGDNEATALPWWAIVIPNNKMGSDAIAAGPFFSRSSAQAHLTSCPHRYIKAAYVYCFSGHASRDYRERVVLNGKR